MNFWRYDKYTALADVIVQPEICTEDSFASCPLYVELWINMKSGMEFYTGECGHLKNLPERPCWRLSNYMIPILRKDEIEAGAEELLLRLCPNALSDLNEHNAFVLAERMGLNVERLPLYNKSRTLSMLFFCAGTVTVQDDPPSPEADPPEPYTVTIPGNTILINTRAVHKDYCQLEIYHECVHYDWHFMFYRLQHMHTNDINALKTRRIVITDSSQNKNPLTWMEWQANRGSFGLMMRKACRDSRDIHLKIEWGYVPSNGGHLLALKLGSIALASAAFYLGLTGEMALPTMLVFAFISFNLFSSLEPISDSAHVLSVIDNAMNQLDALKESHYIDRDGKDIALPHHDIVFSHVDFGYDERKVIRDVSFTIPEKTTTAIVGPSGSGKTTLCSLLARFYDVNSGSITIGRHDLREMTCDSLLSNIAMVFQNVYLFHDTIRANICFGKQDATDEEMIAAAKKARCHDFIMELPDGYDTVIGEGGSTLSGGEKQRISIARAMLKDAPIIILDEATASIDPENEHLIQAAISELTRGKTMIIIAHRLATIEHADQILVLDDGRIAQKGTHAQLIAQDGLYRRFVEIRTRAEGWNLA